MRTLFLLLLMTKMSFAATPATAPAELQARDAFEQLVAARKWTGGTDARQALEELGEAGLRQLLHGTTHPQELVREQCYYALRNKYPLEPRAIEAFIRGLSDADEYDIAYPCAFHLGQHRVAQALTPLRAMLGKGKLRQETRLAAAKSLAELGARDKDVALALYWGLWSDEYYPRMIAGIGIKALLGKDLTDFGYAGPLEDVTFVSGPAVARNHGDFIRKAEARAERYRAIAALSKWLKSEQPELLPELNELW